jgi:hypothetical protein
MSPKQFSALFVCALTSLIIALLAYSSSAERSAALPAGAKVFPSLQQSTSKVTLIEVSQGKTVKSIERTGDKWLIKENAGFPASAEKVRTLLVALGEADLAEPKTKVEARHKLLELEDPKGDNANSFLVRLLDDKGGALAELVVGKKRLDAFGSGKAGSYVRRPDEVQTWLANREISVGTGMRDWVRDRLFEIAPEKIKGASVTVEGNEPYDIELDTDGRTFKLAKMPDGMKLKFMNSADDIVDTLSSFGVDDVRKAGATGGTNIGSATLTTSDGLKLDLRVRKDGDASWLTVTATGNGESRKTADDINGLASGWEFKVPPTQVERIFKKYSDLIEQKPS